MERGPLALFGAIVAVGLGPALWMGVQLGPTPQRAPANPPVVNQQGAERAGQELLGGTGAGAETSDAGLDADPRGNVTPLTSSPTPKPSASSSASPEPSPSTTSPTPEPTGTTTDPTRPTDPTSPADPDATSPTGPSDSTTAPTADPAETTDPPVEDETDDPSDDPSDAATPRTGSVGDYVSSGGR